MTNRMRLTRSLDELLVPERFKDYGPNGLQVEGCLELRKLVSGVTASLALIEAAIAARADAILVHHGLFWRGQDGRVGGWMRQRLALLLAHNVNLYAYHLPLDAHPELGNNAQLGLKLGLKINSRFGEQDLGCMGTAGPKGDGALPVNVQQLAMQIEMLTNRPVTLVGSGSKAIKNIAWCTGGAQNYFEPAIAAGADVFITGEISEPQAHLARETGVSFIACGRHASER